MSLKPSKPDKKKTDPASSLALIRSDGKKRKFFLKDEEVRKNLNKRQLKLLAKSLEARNQANMWKWIEYQHQMFYERDWTDTKTTDYI